MTQQQLHRITNAGNPNILFASILLLVFLLAPRQAMSQKEKASVRITGFSFSMLTGGIVILKATVGNKPDSLNFLLDTGSGGISLDSGTVARLQLPLTPSNRTIRGIAGVRKVEFVQQTSLHLPRLRVDSLDFHVIDYSLLSNVYGIRIDGIIGYSVLSRYIVKLDYDRHLIEFWTHGAIKYPRAGWLLKPFITGIPIFEAAVADHRRVNSRFFFDSGAGLCLLMSEQFEKDSAIIRPGKKITLTQAEGMGGKKPMKVTTVQEVRFGPYRFKKVPAHIFDDEFNITSYPSLGGLIGNEIFRRFNTVINYRMREIHLLPNKHMADPFDYSYTGLGIYLVDGLVLIEDVLEHSPAEKAGFQVGDIIIAIDHNTSGNIQEYKTMLQKTGSKCKVVIMRDGTLQVLVLHIKSIL